MTSRQSLTTPILIICRDQVSHLKMLVEWLERHGYVNLVLIDNASTYGPLLEYFERTPHEVIRLKDNLGARRCVYETEVYERYVKGNYYVVTDSDVVPDEMCPGDVLDYFKWALLRYPRYVKAGVGLRIDDLPSHYERSQDVIEWERQFWRRPLGGGLFEAGIATTFALYRPEVDQFVIRPSMRSGAPYLARHMPWYADSQHPTNEALYYRSHIDVKKSHWTKPNEGLEAGSTVESFSTLQSLRWRLRCLLREERNSRVARRYRPLRGS